MMKVKMLLAALALSAAVATPALAQSFDPDYGGGNITAQPYTYAPQAGYGAYAQSFYGHRTVRHYYRHYRHRYYRTHHGRW